MEKILIEYKQLKKKLSGDPGAEETMDEAMWNDSIMAAMENLIRDLPEYEKNKIRLNHY